MAADRTRVSPEEIGAEAGLADLSGSGPDGWGFHEASIAGALFAIESDTGDVSACNSRAIGPALASASRPNSAA
jgi:hypothetical protein